MGILSNTVSLAQYRLKGSPPKGDLAAWAGRRLAAGGFRTIEETTDEVSIGWVHLDDFNESSFADSRFYLRQNYLAFTLRIDRRKVPAMLLKARLKEAAAEFLAAHPGYTFVPKEKKEDLRDAHRSRLLSRTLPTPSTCDAVWNTQTGIVTFTGLGAPTLQLLEETFEETFPGLGLVPEHPFARAESILSESLRQALLGSDRGKDDALLEKMEKNRWLGSDFLAWVLYRTMECDSSYTVAGKGPLSVGTPFRAWIDERIVLRDTGGEEAQKVTLTGPQKSCSEARASLEDGKEISEARLSFEIDDFQWSMTVRGDTFHLASFKAPPVRIEKDALTDEEEEREAVFYERMLLLDQGIQLLHSLYGVFLGERLGSRWKTAAGKMEAWFRS